MAAIPTPLATAQLGFNLDLFAAKYGRLFCQAYQDSDKGFFVAAGSVLQSRGICALLAFLEKQSSPCLRVLSDFLRDHFQVHLDLRGDVLAQMARDPLLNHLEPLYHARRLLLHSFEYAHAYMKTRQAPTAARETAHA